MLSNVTFTLVSLFSSGLTVLIAVSVLTILLIHLHRQRNVLLLLITNTYAAMMVFSVVLLSTTINVLKMDLYGFTNLTESELAGCRFQGFLIYETGGCFYMTFVLQALHRMVRVIYPRRIFLQAFSFNLICIVLQWVLSFLVVFPSYLWSGPLYSFYPSAYYCGISYDKILGLCYALMNAFVLPIEYIVIIYARLLYFLRHQTPQLATTQQGRRAQRDVMVIRRILFTVVNLALPGLQNLVCIFMVNIDHRFANAYYIYRIQWMGSAVFTFIFSIALIFMTPQLKEICKNVRGRENRVAPAVPPRRNFQRSTAMMETKF